MRPAASCFEIVAHELWVRGGVCVYQDWFNAHDRVALNDQGAMHHPGRRGCFLLEASLDPVFFSCTHIATVIYSNGIGGPELSMSANILVFLYSCILVWGCRQTVVKCVLKLNPFVLAY